MSIKHEATCIRMSPKCKCLTCKHDDDKDVICCIGHNGEAETSSKDRSMCYVTTCPDYEKEEPADEHQA